MGIKKEIILIIVISIFIISMHILTEKYTEKTVDLIYSDAEDVFNELYNREVSDSLNKLKEDWNKNEFILSCYIEHNELDGVACSLAMLEENAKNKEYNQALANGQEFVYWLNHFKEKTKLKIKNIL